jgi:N utilization substance protein B
MALSLKKFREIVFQLLYSRSFEKSEKEAAVFLAMRTNAVPKSTMRKAADLVEAVWAVIEVLDNEIAQNAKDYEFERISRVEKSILRLGLYELLYTDLPPKVSIAEAVRLTKKYATQEGANFVNALLDQLYKEKESAQKISIKQIAQ